MYEFLRPMKVRHETIVVVQLHILDSTDVLFPVLIK